MRGLVLDSVERITYRDDLPDPSILAPSDAIVAVSRAGLCGSDLHPYGGREAVRFGVVPGHEAVGTVAAVGSDVGRFVVGQRVLVPFTTSCGRCDPCRRGLTARCVRGELFGFGSADDPDAPALHGGQAEALRVPLADSTLVAVPDDIADVAAVLLTDNLPTGWCAVERAAVRRGQTVVVIGLGAVGLCAVVAAQRQGAGRVVAVDPVASRRARATRLGATAVTPDEAPSLVGLGRPDGGAPAVIDAAGTTRAQTLARSLVRPGGTLSVIAFHTADRFGFTPVQAYDVNLTVRTGRASARAVLGRIMPIAAGLVGHLAAVLVTHPAVPLAEGPESYRRFARREIDTLKIVFAP